MFLIEYNEGKFLNAELISKVLIDEGSVMVVIEDEEIIIESKKEALFLNNLQALNDNIQNIEAHYHKIKGTYNK